MNLLVFCDGTWNTPQQLDDGKPAPTNVVKLRNAVAENTQQRVYYHSGVGTDGGGGRSLYRRRHRRRP
ncbi:Uncharacterized conserved protein [Raoultella planticola]|nr:Uncharacterized conserved protein [Raoultella planticola]